MNRVPRLIDTSGVLRWLPWVIIAMGAVLRIVRFLHDRALWGDESALALNLMHRSPRGLLEPLDFNQAAPVLFLLTEKLAGAALGYTGYALRAVPLLAGLASLILFWSVARRILDPLGATVGLAFFAVSDPLVFYSAEVKQYGLDLTLAMLLLVLILPVLEGSWLTRWRAGALGLFGVSAVWFSHPSVFLLAGVGLVLLGMAFLRPSRVKLVTVALLCTAWAVSFLISYLFVLPNTKTVQDELSLAGGGARAGETSILRQVLTQTWDSFSYPLGAAATATGLAAVAIVTGLLVLYRRNPALTLTLAAPGVLAVGAALVNRYPWGDRFVLFLVPAVILLMSAGVDELRKRTWDRLPVVSIGVVTLLLAYPAAVSAKGLFKPPAIKRQEIKRSLSVLEAGWRRGDALYVHYVSQYALRYYAECEECGTLEGWEARLRGWDALTDVRPVPETVFEHALKSRPPDLIVGEGQRPSFEQLTRQLTPLRGRARVWLLFSTTTNQEFLLYLLDGWGRRLEVVTDPEVALYLYDLRRAS